MFAGDIFYILMFTRASKNLHDSLLFSILRCNMQFFESTPIGRILNRFSKDIESCERQIPDKFKMFFRSFLTVLSVIIVISITMPLFLIMFLPIFGLYLFIQVFILYFYIINNIHISYIIDKIKKANICTLLESNEASRVSQSIAHFCFFWRITKRCEHNKSILCSKSIHSSNAETFRYKF